jgi:hypothetical protein
LNAETLAAFLASMREYWLAHPELQEACRRVEEGDDEQTYERGELIADLSAELRRMLYTRCVYEEAYYFIAENHREIGCSASISLAILYRGVAHYRRLEPGLYLLWSACESLRDFGAPVTYRTTLSWLRKRIANARLKIKIHPFRSAHHEAVAARHEREIVGLVKEMQRHGRTPPEWALKIKGEPAPMSPYEMEALFRAPSREGRE